MIDPQEALKIVLNNVPLLPAEQMPIGNALGRILRQDCIADIDLPPFDRATMDGYAVRAADTATAPVRLKVLGEVAAGAVFPGAVSIGQAVRIMTGAPIPAGADSVQKVEVTRAEGDEVEIQEPTKVGQFISRRGSQVSCGEVIIKAGTRIGAAEQAVLATFGYSHPTVSRPVRVAVLATGSELVDVDHKPAPSQIRNSNNYTIGGFAARAGAEVTNLGHVVDDSDLIEEKMREGFAQSDVLILSGGVSMGDYDLVKACLKRLGAEIFFDKVSIRPGKPTVFGRLGEKVVFGLPGNPVSVSVTFNVFARPALLAMMGASEVNLLTVRAALADAVKNPPERNSYLPAKLEIVDGQAQVRRLKWEGSSDLVAFMRGDCLLIIPQGCSHKARGEIVDVMILER